MSRIILGAGAVAAIALLTGSASAQVLMGTSPYAPRSPSTFSAQAHISERLSSSSSSGGMGALNEYVSSSTTVGNINNVTVGDNSNAAVDANQTTTGDQDSTAKITSTSNAKTVNNNPAAH
jgi:uncharacterized protein YidB (DUF937 family)